MKNIFIYFSSTGNSLLIAKWLSKLLPNSTCIHISQIPIFDRIGDKDTNIGFIFPTYFFSVPQFYTEKIRSFQFDSRAYFYGITTCNGYPGNTGFQLNQTLAKMNCELSQFFSITMPGNYILEYDAPNDTIVNERILNAKIEITNISKYILKKEHKVITPRWRFVSAAFRKIMCRKQDIWHKDFHINTKCTGCGFCTRVCPFNNIEIVGHKPYWNDNCQHCVACIQLCPHHAIEYGNRSQKRKRYRNPLIEVKELVH